MVKRKYIFLIIFLGIFLLAMITASAERFTVTLNQDDVLDDGEIEMGGVPNKVNDTDLALARNENNVDKHRGFINFDISSLPGSATIMHAKLVLQVIARWGKYKAVIWDLYHDTRTATTAQIEADCANGTNFGNKFWDTGEHSYDLDNINNASVRIGENITRGWWGIGLDANGIGIGSGYQGIQFACSEHSSYTSPKLVISYELNAPIVNNTLTTPLDNAQNINLSTKLCINVSHPNGNPMVINWLWYNSSSSSWETFARNGTLEDFEDDADGADPTGEFYTFDEWDNVGGANVISNVSHVGTAIGESAMYFNTQANGNEQINAFNFTNGAYKWINWSLYPLRDGAVNRMTFVVRNATDNAFGVWFEEATNNIELLDNAPWHDTGQNWAQDNWYNLSLHANYTTHEFEFLLNGTSLGWYTMNHPVNNIESFWFYDTSNTRSFDAYIDNLGISGLIAYSLANGTYCTDATWATQPCTTYYWSVDIYDDNGNLTQELYEFTTHCIESPSGITCVSPTPTSINVSFVPMESHGGTTYTEMYYTHGGNPPVYGGGTFAGNTTKEFFLITNLDEGQCYAFSLWTFWHASDGRWFQSSVSHKLCCGAGGDYWVMFFDEETRQPLNFTKYPWDDATFALKVHYYSTTEDTFYIRNNSVPTIWRDTNVEDLTFVNISATQDVWYFELIVNYNYNHNNLISGETSRTQYKRCLTPHAAIYTNITTLPWDVAQWEARESLYFYVANLTTYGANYWYHNGTAINELLDADFEDSVIKYEYDIYDQTGQIVSSFPNEAFITIYERNLTNDIIIHQEYIDANGKINPALIYEKDYLLGANSSDYNITNFGIAPTDTDLTPIIIIKTEFSEEYLTSDIDIDWTFSGSTLSIDYVDNQYRTTSITLYLYENNTNASNLKKTETVHVTSHTFTYNNVVENATYIAVFKVEISDIIEGYSYEASLSITRLMFQGIDSLIEQAGINNLIVGIVGLFPVPGMTWVSFFVLIISLFIMLIVFAKAGPVAGFLSGAFILGFLSAIVSDLSPTNLTIAIILGTLGFIIMISKRGDR